MGNTETMLGRQDFIYSIIDKRSGAFIDGSDDFEEIKKEFEIMNEEDEAEGFEDLNQLVCKYGTLHLIREGVVIMEVEGGYSHLEIDLKIEGLVLSF